MNGTIRQVCRNVKRWQDAKMALRWTGAAMLEAANGFRRLKAHKQLPVLRGALAAHQAKHASNPHLEQQAKAAYCAIGCLPADGTSHSLFTRAENHDRGPSHCCPVNRLTNSIG